MNIILYSDYLNKNNIYIRPDILDCHMLIFTCVHLHSCTHVYTNVHMRDEKFERVEVTAWEMRDLWNWDQSKLQVWAGSGAGGIQIISEECLVSDYWISFDWSVKLSSPGGRTPPGHSKTGSSSAQSWSFSVEKVNSFICYICYIYIVR